MFVKLKVKVKDASVEARRRDKEWRQKKLSDFHLLYV